MKISVTRKHINDGVPKNTELCAIALAVNELLNEDVILAVTGQELVFKPIVTQGGQRISLLYPVGVWIPDFVSEFIARFDDSNVNFEELKPFEFEADIPARFLKTQKAPAPEPVQELELELVGA